MGRGGGCMDWFIYLDSQDWHSFGARFRNWCPCIAGALFGAAWWCWADAVLYTKAVEHQSFPFSYNLPGWVATLAILLMNLVSRQDLQEAEEHYSGDDSAATRAKCWLFLSYIVAFAAVAGSAAVLVQCAQAGVHLWLGVGGLLQCGLILAGGLLLWAFRTQEDSGYAGYSNY